MILFPAIDLKDGECVRLVHGEMGSATVFNPDPAAQAARLESQGFAYLHLVDLDGAFAGRPRNVEAVQAVLDRVEIPVQLGGGIRDLRTAETWLSRGIRRVILGTAAVKDPGFVREASRLFPGQVAVGIDARDGLVAVEGWAKTVNLTAVELGRRFEDAGVAAIIMTDIGRDGAMKGLNLPGTVALAEAVHLPVIASGGLASLADVSRLLEPDCRKLAGAITGRALYDGRLDATAALAMIRAAREGSEAEETRL